MKKKPEVKTKEFKVYMPFSVKEDSDESILKIKGWANFCGNMSEDGSGAFVDHMHEVIVPSGFDLSVWKKNPQIFWQHDNHYPCGKGIKATKKAEGLEVEAEVHQKAMHEEDWYRVKSGMVSYFSVGFRCKAGEWKEVNGKQVYFITKALLLEVSLVSIPCNSESGFSIIKSLNEDGFYGGELDEYKEQEKQLNTEGEDVMKIKRKDLLSADDVQKLKSLGLDEQLEDLVDVDLKEYIAGIVKAELEAIREVELKAKLEAEEKANAEAAEKAKAEAELKEKEEADLKAKIDAEVEESIKSLLSKLELTQKEIA